MKAIYYEKYGDFDVLGVRAIEKPVVTDNEVLVQVRAAGLHVGDCFSVRGAPFLMRVESGLRKPKYSTPGFDLAGEVVAVGKNVRRFQIGDQVFGATHATCAEYSSASQDTLAIKPASLSFEEAAALPTSCLAALHALRDVGKIEPWHRVLINGASGGVGTFAVQIAKSYGAEVTGVCSTENADLVRSLGADVVVDYTREDFTTGAKRYDIILDTVENRSLAECRRALAPRGTLILNSGTGAEGIGMLVRLIKPLLISPFVGQNLRRYLSRPNHRDLVGIAELVEAGTVQPVIDRQYALEETPAALKHIDSGHARGKVVVTVA